MAFNRDYILEKIEETEDGEYASSDLFTKEDMPEDVPENLKKLIEQAGNVVGFDYVDLGEGGYDAYGLYYFAPQDDEDPCLPFSAVITLTDQLHPIGLSSMYQLINRINAVIPEGAFVISEDETTLYYRSNSYIPKVLDDEEALHVAGIRMFQAIALVAGWIDVLMGLQDGTLSFEDCIGRTKMTAEV